MSASRSLIALLVGTVVFFALWVVALKPSSSSNGANKSQQGLGSFQSAINKAHQAVTTSNANDAASGGGNANSRSSGAASKTSTKSSSTAATKSTTSSAAKATAARQNSVARELSTIRAAVTGHKVVALLFYNPAASDDQAVKQELSAVPTHRGQVVKLEIPLNQAASFTAVTQQVPLNLSPTLVLISRAGNAEEIVGYTAPFVIGQHVQDALAAS